MKKIKTLFLTVILMFSMSTGNAQNTLMLNAGSNPSATFSVMQSTPSFVDTIYVPVVLTDSMYVSNLVAYLGNNIGTISNYRIEYGGSGSTPGMVAFNTTTQKFNGIPVTDNLPRRYRLKTAPTSGITLITFWVVGITGTSTGIDKDVKSKSDVKAYPNPATDKLTVDFNATSHIQNIDIFDIQGRVVLSNTDEREIGSNSVKIDVSALNKGIYFVRVGTDTFKVTKQ